MRTDRGSPKTELKSGKLQKSALGVSLSFAHYRPQAECLSTWGKSELKSFVRAMDKMRGMNIDQLRFSDLCSAHKYEPKLDRFARPATIGKDHTMHEIRVDNKNSARMHGVIEGSIFYLVWLDRKHELFPSKKG